MKRPPRRLHPAFALASVLLACCAAAAAPRGGVLGSLEAQPRRLEGYSCTDSVTSRMATQALHPIEGLWQLAGDGTVLAIERDPFTPGGAAALYRMVLVEPRVLNLPPGTVVGWLTPTPVKGQYDGRLFTAMADDHVHLRSPRRVLLTLGPGGDSLTFKSVGRTLRFNWWRLLLPYLYRSLVTPLEGNTSVPDGCVRLYPAPARPLNPVYL